MKHVVASLTIGACLLLSSAGVVLAENPHGTAAGLFSAHALRGDSKNQTFPKRILKLSIYIGGPARRALRGPRDMVTLTSLSESVTFVI